MMKQLAAFVMLLTGVLAAFGPASHLARATAPLTPLGVPLADYRRAPDAWLEIQKLAASDAENGDQLGGAVALNGSTALVGARGEDGAGLGRGAAYVFTESGGVWSEQAKLTAADAQNGDRFGGAVALNGSTALVGAQFEDGAGGGITRGAAYVYTESGGVWSQQAKLIASDAEDGDWLGGAVALSGSTALVGAYGEDGAGGAGAERGAVYVFTESSGVWSEQAKLTASDTGDLARFGWSVALDGTTALVGAYREDGTGGAGAERGAVYVFAESGGVWTEQAKLTASDAADGDWFGYSVALSGSTALVSAVFNDGAGFERGAAYVFTESGGVWSEQAKLTAADAQNLDRFGWSVALDSSTALVGARGEDGAGLGRGAAYVFTESGGVWSEQAKLTAADAQDLDVFGTSVALAGGTALVGANGEDGGAGDPLPGAGATYLFELVLSPTVEKAFDPDTIGVGETSTLTFTIANPNPRPLTGLNFADSYPAGVQNTDPLVVGGTCGAITHSATAGGAEFDLTGATIGAAASCMVTVEVTATAPGDQANTTGVISAAESGPGTDIASAVLAVRAATSAPGQLAGELLLSDPALNKTGELAPGHLGLPGETITWTITATAPEHTPLTDVLIADTLPEELRIKEVTTSAGTASVSGQTVRVGIAWLSAGSRVTVRFTTTIVSIPAAGVFTNIATLTTDDGISLQAVASVVGVSGLPDTGYPPGR